MNFKRFYGDVTEIDATPFQIKQQMKERAQQATAGNNMPSNKKPAVEEDEELEEKIEL